MKGLTILLTVSLLPAQQRVVTFVSHPGNRQTIVGPLRAGTALARGQIASGEVGSIPGVIIRYRTVAEPPTETPVSFGSRTWSSTGRLHRLLFDNRSRQYFGYDLAVQPGAENNVYEAAFQPLTDFDAILALFTPRTGLKEAAQLKYPEPQVVHAGDTIATDVMVAADGKQRIVDYLEILPGDLPAATTMDEPRDYTVDDSPIRIDADSFQRVTVLIDGQKFSGRVGYSLNDGGVLWFVFPGQGRFLLSLAPHEGFERAGTIRDHAIAFAGGEHNYEVRLAKRIAPAGNAWNLYLRSQANFRLKPAMADAVVCGTGRLAELAPALFGDTKSAPPK